MCSIILSLLFAIFKRGFEPKLYFWIQRDWLLTICLWDFLHVFTLHTLSLFWPSVDLKLTSRQHHYLLWQTQKLVSLSKSFPCRAKNSNRASVIHRFLPNTHTRLRCYCIITSRRVTAESPCPPVSHRHTSVSSTNRQRCELKIRGGGSRWDLSAAHGAVQCGAVQPGSDHTLSASRRGASHRFTPSSRVITSVSPQLFARHKSQRERRKQVHIWAERRFVFLRPLTLISALLLSPPLLSTCCLKSLQSDKNVGFFFLLLISY